MSLSRLSRQAISVLLAMAHAPDAGATYRGLAQLLGTRTDSGTRQAVRAARREGLVVVIHTPDGRGARAVIRLTILGRTLLETVLRKEP